MIFGISIVHYVPVDGRIEVIGSYIVELKPEKKSNEYITAGKQK